ncbi:MAG: dTDP-4-dehydrorhamnose 3,5-epimerase family protein [bacterium]
MKFTEQKIPGVWIIEQEEYSDERGIFLRHFCQHEYAEHGLNKNIRQTNISKNFKKYTLRGFHYQSKPFQEAKTITCMQGHVYLVVVDLRPESKTLYSWISFELRQEKSDSLYISAGCAVAFLSLADNSMILYYMAEFFSANSYKGFRYNDPFLILPGLMNLGLYLDAIEITLILFPKGIKHEDITYWGNRICRTAYF